MRGDPTRRSVNLMSTANVSHETSARTGSEDVPRGLRWRIVMSILVPITWLCVTLLYVGFWASNFSLFQSIIVILVSTLIMGGVMGAAWTVWGPRYRHAWD